MEREMRPAFVSNNIGFHYDLFDEIDLEYNLDYIDSNGVRHAQRLAEIEYSNSDIPNILSASLDYIPSDQRSQNSDVYVGVVASKIPEIGKRTHYDSSTISRLLSKTIASSLLIESSIHATTDRLYIHDTNTNTLIEIDIRLNTDGTLYIGVSIPSEPTLPIVERYDDARLAADLWALLHDFSVNLSMHLGLHSDALGDFAYSKNEPHQTLRIGIPRAKDCCRFGMAVLVAQSQLDELESKYSSTPLSKDLNYELWDTRLASCSDEDMNEILLRAITIASENEVTNDIIDSSMLMTAELKRSYTKHL
jgi:hypothetical protein